MSDETPPAPRMTRNIVVAIALVGVAVLLWINRTALILAFGAVVFGLLLHTLGEAVSRHTKLKTKWGVLVAVAVLVLVTAAMCWFFGTRVSREFGELREQLPKALEGVEKWLAQSSQGAAAVDSLKESARTGLSKQFGLAAEAIVGAVGTLLLIVFSAIYIAFDPGLYRRGALRLLPPKHRPHVGQALSEAGTALKKWIRAQVLLMLVVGTLTGVGLAFVGVPLAFALAIIIGLLEFVPLVGPIVGAIPGVLLAFTKGPDVAIYAALVYIAVQQIENHLLTPLIQRWAVELPPVVALFSIVIAGGIFGLPGIVFATPLAVVVTVLVQHLYVEEALEKKA